MFLLHLKLDVEIGLEIDVDDISRRCGVESADTQRRREDSSRQAEGAAHLREQAGGLR